jgi:hypothetical protein
MRLFVALIIAVLLFAYFVLLPIAALFTKIVHQYPH